MTSQRLALIVVVLALIILGVFAYKRGLANRVSDYDSCVKAGNQVMETFPAQCVTPDGRTFTQPLTPEQQKGLIPSS